MADKMGGKGSLMGFFHAFRRIVQLFELPENMHPGAYFLLCLIENRTSADGGGLRVSSICKEVGGTMPATSQMVGKLEKRGWVERVNCDEDRRCVYVSITEEGERLLSTVRSQNAVLYRRIESSFGEGETASLFGRLQDFLAIAEAEAAEVRKEI